MSLWKDIAPRHLIYSTNIKETRQRLKKLYNRKYKGKIPTWIPMRYRKK
jgi:hypothetical protein